MNWLIILSIKRQKIVQKNMFDIYDFKSCSVKGTVMECWAETCNAANERADREASPTRCYVLVLNRNMAANNVHRTFASRDKWTIEKEDKLVE